MYVRCLKRSLRSVGKPALYQSGIFGSTTNVAIFPVGAIGPAGGENRSKGNPTFYLHLPLFLTTIRPTAWTVLLHATPPDSNRQRRLAMTRATLSPGLLFLTLMLTGTAWGQFTTAVAPARVEQLVNPGSKVEDVITFTNQGDVPVTVSVSLVDFDVDEAGEVTELPPGTHPSTLAPYFRIAPVRTVVGPKEEAHFRFSVQTPDAFDQLRAFVYFESQPVVDEGGSKQVLFATAMGIPLYVENRRANRGALTVHDVSWERIGDEQHYVQLKLHVTNEGARNIRPGGFLTIRSADDTFAETFDVNTGKDVVLPGHERHLTMQFGPVPDDALSLKLRFETSMRSDYQADHLLPKPSPAQKGDE